MDRTLESEKNNKKGCSNPKGMLRTAKGPFSYMYPMIAKQLIADYNINEGLGLDVGCGPGLLGIELVKRSNLNMISIDISEEMCEIAQNVVLEKGLEERLTILNADVENLPFKEKKFNYIVSRGSFI